MSILLKRGTEATIPTLAAGEPAWTTDTHKLFIGDGTGNHQIGGGGSGTVTSVGLSMPSIFSVSGSPVTTSGTLTASLATQSANTIFAGPSSGTAAAPTFRSLVAADLPASGATPGTYTNATITVDAKGRITAASSGGGGGGGTVTSVDLSMPGVFTVSGNPITTSGTLTVGLAFQLPNQVWAGPSVGTSGPPSFRALVAADLPTSGVTPGSYTNANLTVDAYGRITSVGNGSGGSGTVTSVNASGGTTGLSFSGGPITSAGTLTLGGTLGIGNGGTGATNGPAARAFLNIESQTAGPDAAYTILATDRVIVIPTLTAARTYTLPSALATNPGQLLVIYAPHGTLTATNTLTVNRAGTDTIDLAGSSVTGVTIAASGSQLLLWSNGTNGWNAIELAGTNTGDVTLNAGGAGYLTLTGQQINAGTVGPLNGGTGLTAYTLGDVLYSNAANSLARLAGNTTTTRKFLRQLGTGSASAAPAWDTLTTADMPAGVPTAAATQTDQEAASSTSAYVTPGRQHFHPAMPKAWAQGTVSGGVVTVTAGFNVGSVTRVTTGTLELNYANSLSAVGAPWAAADAGVIGITGGAANQSTAKCRIAFTTATTGALTDPANFLIAVFGDMP